MKKLIIIAIILICTNTFAQEVIFDFKDLAELSKSDYGFLNSDGTINEYFGDIECTSVERKTFDFNVGCGKCGDIILVIIRPNAKEVNTFDMFLPAGHKFYGEWTSVEKHIGELVIVSQNEINGKIKLCLEEDYCCCGEEGEIFTLVKIK